MTSTSTVPSVHRDPKLPDEAPVLVGTDGSPQARRAVDWAAQWAHQHGVGLTMLTATRTASRFSAVSEQGLTRQLLAELAQVASQHPELVLHPALIDAAAPTALLRAARHAELVVVGARGLGGWQGLTIGSVALQVASQAACPVVVVPDPAHPVHADRPVVLGFDGTADSCAAAEFALGAADQWQVPLLAVLADERHRWGERSRPLTTTELSGEQGRCSRRLAQLADRWPRVRLERRHLLTDPAEALNRLAPSASLLVLGRIGAGGAVSMGSTARRVLRRAVCPVAIVSEPPFLR